MRIPLLLFFFFLFVFSAKATHIVGGEFQIKHNSGFNYKFTLNLYFDKLNGNPGAVDQNVNVTIFEKGTNIRKRDFTMPLRSQTAVAYTNIACTSTSLSTDKLVYDLNQELQETLFNSPNGYYIVWERCCRNNVINNIINPGGSGQTFYLEFPPVVKNGVRFINSSPELFPPLSDYACINDLFYYDFGGTDIDGDSMVYEMITPLNGFSGQGNPAPSAMPGPYPEIFWTNGSDSDNQIVGNPSVSITRNSGLLTLRPTKLGLFVFGVRCTEYRNKVKIGEVRRDFQLLVLNCPKNEQPKISLKLPGKSSFYKEGEIITIKATDNRCLNVYLSDFEANSNLKIEAKPVNFTNINRIFNLTSGVVNRGGIKDSLLTSGCFPACLNSEGKTYIIDFIVSDDGCSLPKKDTVRVSFRIDPIPNAGPEITTTATTTVIKPKVGDILQFDVTGTDADNDLVTLGLLGENFTTGGQSITFPGGSRTGSITSRFTWKIDCKALSQPNYRLQFTSTSIICGKSITKTTIIEVQPQFTNTEPTIASNLNGRTIDLLFGTPVSDSIFGDDIDLHKLSITAAGQGFNLADYGMAFTTKNGFGKARAQFSWTPDCNTLDRNQFKIDFTLTEDTCKASPPIMASVTFNIIYELPKTFNPANIFTPNNDGLNDFFTMPTLPTNFCESVFSDIKIYNRWGNLIYRSTNRDFKWDGKNVADGVYYYHLTYSDKTFKGNVTIVK